MPWLSKIPETASRREAVWAPEYQALFRSLPDITVLHSNDEQDGVVNLIDFDASYLPLDHYRTLVIALYKYSILLSPEDGSAGHTATKYRRGLSFPDNPTPADTDIESRFHQGSYDICKHVSTLCYTASADRLLWYAEEETLETFLPALKEYMLVRLVDPAEHEGEDVDTSPGDRADTPRAVGPQRSVNKDWARGIPQNDI